MPNLSSLVKQLRKERDRVAKQLSGLNAALTAFAGVYGGVKPVRKRRKMSVAAKKKIAAAQRRRWANFKAKRKKLGSAT
jgi:hypothetical protein